MAKEDSNNRSNMLLNDLDQSAIIEPDAPSPFIQIEKEPEPVFVQ